MRSRTIVVLGLALLAGAARAGGPAGADAWFPLTPGATWNYHLTYPMDISGPSGPLGVDSRDRSVTVERFKDADSTITINNLAYAVREDGVYEIGIAGPGARISPFEEPRKVVPVAPKLGDKWEYRESAGRTSAACLGMEKVKVAAGEYEAAKIYLITVGGRDGANRREVYSWFVKDVGLVKQTTSESAPAKALRETSLELKSFVPPKSGAPATNPIAGGEKSPDAAEALLATAQAAARKGDHAAALRAYDRALEADPKFAKAHAYKTLSLIALKRYDAAEAEVNQALAADPKDYTYAEIAGQLKVAQGQVREGTALYQKAAGLAPASAGAVYTDLAAALSARNDERLSGDIDAALKAAIAATPPSAPALFALGQSYANAGRPEAKGFLQRYVEVASALPKEQRDEQKIRLAKQLIRAIDIVRGAP